MKSVARAVTALALLALATPALPCGFEKSSATTTMAPTPAPAARVARSEKAKAPKAVKGTVRTPSAARGAATSTAAN